MKKPCVYILFLENGQYYIGSSNDFERRYGEHLQCNHAGTKYAKPLRVEPIQYFEDYGFARRVEAKLKRLKSRIIIEKIIDNKKIDISLLGA